MTVEELYERIGGDYAAAKKILMMDKMIARFIGKLPGDPSFERLMAGSGSEDYVSVTLTDDSTIPEAMPRLRTRYPRMLDFGYAFEQIRNRTGAAEEVPAERKSPFELFAGFFAMQNGREMDEEQRAIIEQLIEQIWEEHV